MILFVGLIYIVVVVDDDDVVDVVVDVVVWLFCMRNNIIYGIYCKDLVSPKVQNKKKVKEAEAKKLPRTGVS
jgi:hypothetical protein